MVHNLLTVAYLAFSDGRVRKKNKETKYRVYKRYYNYNLRVIAHTFGCTLRCVDYSIQQSHTCTLGTSTAIVHHPVTVDNIHSCSFAREIVHCS